MSTQVVLDLRRPYRRVDGYGYATGQQHAEETVQIVASGGQHDGDMLSGLQATFLQTRSDRLSPFKQRQVADFLRLIPCAIQIHMRTLWMRVHMPVELLQQCMRILRRTRRCTG